MPVMLSQQMLGRRVVLRYRRAVDDGRPPLSDVVGELIGLTDAVAVVMARTGKVAVELSRVVLARPVAASRRDILELERISRRGWRAESVTELDGWLLFADRGWTGRANSVLPLRTPSRPLEELLARVAEHYTSRGLAVQIQLPMPARQLLDEELAGRHWTVERPTVVLTSPVAAAAPPPLPGLVLAGAPDADWLAGYHYRGGPLPDFAQQLLRRHDLVTFATVYRGGTVAAIGRATVDEGWLGVTAVEVQSQFRRQGLGRALMQQLMAWGAGQGAHSCYLQVDEANRPAVGLYAGLGFNEHHRYHYRLRPRG
jgi:GNAT superfamily N-acetyltransferase